MSKNNLELQFIIENTNINILTLNTSNIYVQVDYETIDNEKYIPLTVERYESRCIYDNKEWIWNIHTDVCNFTFTDSTNQTNKSIIDFIKNCDSNESNESNESDEYKYLDYYVDEFTFLESVKGTVIDYEKIITSCQNTLLSNFILKSLAILVRYKLDFVKITNIPVVINKETVYGYNITDNKYYPYCKIILNYEGDIIGNFDYEPKTNNISSNIQHWTNIVGKKIFTLTINFNTPYNQLPQTHPLSVYNFFVTIFYVSTTIRNKLKHIKNIHPSEDIKDLLILNSYQEFNLKLILNC